MKTLKIHVKPNAKKNIAIICDKNPCTSFGRMTLDMRKVLAEEFDVHVIWLKTPKYFPNDYELPDCSHTISAPSLELGWLLFRRPLRRLLRKIKPDKALLIHQGTGFLVREIRRTLPKTWVGVIIHDMFPKTLYPRSMKYKLFYKYFISPARAADCFMYNSEYTKAETGRTIGLAPNNTITGCPIDASVFRSRKGEKPSMKQKWGLDNYRGVCLNISLDEPRKNIGTFFSLAKARPETAFVRVGPFSPWMKRWIDENRVSNIIHFSGISQEHLLELYGCADLFIYPSFAEGFGMPPLEALACGVPAAAASTSALKENLEGIAPLVDPPDNIDGYLEVIDTVLAGKNVVNWEAADELLERFSIENFGRKIRHTLLKNSTRDNNIAIDARMILDTGIGVYIQHLIRNINYTFAAGEKERLLDYFSEDRIIQHKCSNYSIMEQVFFPYKQLRAKQIDILHVPYLNIPVFYKGKLAVTIHDLTPLTFPQFLPTKLHYFYCRFMVRLACKKAFVIFTVSENTKKDIIRFFNVDPNKISVTPLAAGEEFIRKEKNETFYLQKKYNIPAGKKVILYVGNLLPHKNLSALLKAFNLLKNKDECCLVIAGNIFEKRLKLNWNEPSIIYTGFVNQNELVDFYNLADLLVFPSMYEGFGLPVLESFACGTPVACSRTSSLPEVGGEFSFYFDPSDENDIAAQIEKALNSKQNPEELRDYALRFSWKKTAELTLNALNSVL